jgi:hypothetical protein
MAVTSLLARTGKQPVVVTESMTPVAVNSTSVNSKQLLLTAPSSGVMTEVYLFLASDSATEWIRLGDTASTTTSTALTDNYDVSGVGGNTMVLHLLPGQAVYGYVEASINNIFVRYRAFTHLSWAGVNYRGFFVSNRTYA